MDRRRFLQLTAMCAGVPFIVRNAAWAHDIGTMGPGQAPSPALTKGRPLPELNSLDNQANKIGYFQSTLLAVPTEAHLVADNTHTILWTYGGSFPGPLIDVSEEDWLDIAFINHLPQPTTVHWHGLAVPASQDGNPMDLVSPGATRHYRYQIPKGSAGTYWYHPHPHRLSAEQVARGMVGPIIVRPPKDPLDTFTERDLFITDLRLSADASIAPNTPADWHDGRQGDHVLINGALEPVISLGRGQIQRWRVWNATSARFLKLALPGHEMWLVGTDGGLIERPRRIDNLPLAPAARAELLVKGIFTKGGGGELLTLPYPSGKMMHQEDTAPRVLARVVEAPADGLTPPMPTHLRHITALPAPKVKRRVEFTEDMANPQATFLINGHRFDMSRIDFVGHVGQVEEWEVVSNTHMDHPFHLHGGQFQVVARFDGKHWTPEPFLAWRDVVNVPARQAVRIRFRQDLPGVRMFHCHILEHEDLGMMGQFQVNA